MDASAGPQPGQPPAGAPAQQHLIRPEQVSKLPHLNAQAKQQQEAVVQQLWDKINSSPPNSTAQQNAYSKLGHVSHHLMQGMKAYQNMRKQQQLQQQQAAAQQNAGGGAGQAGGDGTQLKDLSALVQQRVNAAQFVYPPSTPEGS